MLDNDSQPIISLVIAARNDSYMGDFRWRLSTTLDFFAMSAAGLGRLNDVEIVVCDWNSDTPLHVDLPLTPEAAQITKFVVVPPAVALVQQGDRNYPYSIPFNVAARRARGRFIGLTGSDILYTASSLQIMLNVLEKKLPGVNADQAVLIAGRRHVPVHFIQRRPSLSELASYVNRNAAYLPDERGHLGSGAPTNLIMLPREIWFDCRGVDEEFNDWGWNDIDLVLRVTQRYPLVVLDHFGVNVLHLEHWTEKRDYDPKKMFRKSNRPNDTPSFVVNGPNWGLSDLPLAIERSQNVNPIVHTPLPPPGAVERWDLSADRLVTEFRSEQVTSICQLAIDTCRGQAAQFETAALQALAWYALSRRPRCYVEIGMRYPIFAALVARVSPGVEVYGLVDWERPRSDEHLFADRVDSCLYFYASNAIRGFGQQWAHTRFVGGDPSTVVRRLMDSTFESPKPELIFVRADTPFAFEQTMELSSHLIPGGALIISASNADTVRNIADAVRSFYPLFSVVNYEDGRTAMLLAAQL